MQVSSSFILQYEGLLIPWRKVRVWAKDATSPLCIFIPFYFQNKTKIFFLITSSPFRAFIFVLHIQDKGVIGSWIIPRPFPQTQPLSDYFSGTGTRTGVIPASCTFSLPLLLRVDHLECLLKATTANDSISKVLEQILFCIHLILKSVYQVAARVWET